VLLLSNYWSHHSAFYWGLGFPVPKILVWVGALFGPLWVAERWHDKNQEIRILRQRLDDAARRLNERADD
jgi:hypothetical protein